MLPEPHPRSIKSELTGMGPGLILKHSQGKWMPRPIRQRRFIKKALTINRNKPSLKAAPQLFQATSFTAQVTESSGLQRFIAVLPRSFSKMTKLPKNSPGFHVCNSWNYVVLEGFFFPENTCVLLFHGLTWHKAPSSFAHQISLNYMLLLLLQASARDLQLTVGWFKP